LPPLSIAPIKIDPVMPLYEFDERLFSITPFK
jgi:hypothetical protein